jgi:hypothetical protein
MISTLPRLPGNLITILFSTNNSLVAHGLFDLFRNEYIFDLEHGVVIETPELGHATYVFAKPKSIDAFLAEYVRTGEEAILDNRSNVADRLGYLGRVVHGANPRGWLKKIKAHIGETPDFAQL